MSANEENLLDITKLSPEQQEEFARAMQEQQAQQNPFKFLEEEDEKVINNFNEYLEKAVATSATKESDLKTRLLHSVCGIVGEINETIQIDRKGAEEVFTEIGDILWYVAEGFDALNKNKPDTIKEQFEKITNEIQTMEKQDIVISDFDTFIKFNTTQANRIYSKVNESNLMNKVSFEDEKFIILSFTTSLLEDTKKVFFYNKEVSDEYIVKFFIVTMNVLHYCQRHCNIFISMFNGKEEYKDNILLNIANANIKKLSARYSNKEFTEEEANNRDYQKESEAANLKGE